MRETGLKQYLQARARNAPGGACTVRINKELKDATAENQIIPRIIAPTNASAAQAIRTLSLLTRSMGMLPSSTSPARLRKPYQIGIPEKGRHADLFPAVRLGPADNA
jgi:hypothetical protein